MASPLHSGKVLIIDPDESIRLMVATLLHRAGFATTCVGERETALAEADPRDYDVIVRDCDLSPRNRKRALQELAETPPAILGRTVVITTMPADILARENLEMPYAVITKPFSCDALLNAVRQCRERQSNDPASDSAPSAREETETDGVSLATVTRFLRTAPRVRALLVENASSDREQLLRVEMQRTLMAFECPRRGAKREKQRLRAEVLEHGARVADHLGRSADAEHESGHDTSH